MNSRTVPDTDTPVPATGKPKRRGVPPRPIIEFPDAMPGEWDDPADFSAALTLHMERHGDSVWHLHRAVSRPGESFDRTTIREWRAGRKAPRSAVSLRVLARIEHRYRLPVGYFRAKLPHPGRAATGHAGSVALAPAERRRLAWHLPDDFDARPIGEREEILEWVRRVVVSGATDYRRYQAGAVRQRFAVRFPDLTGVRARTAVAVGGSGAEDEDEGVGWQDDVEAEVADGTVDAPPALAAEIAALIRLKTSTLTAIGLQRLGVWNEATALQKIEHLGLLFGALAASPCGAVRGRGVPLDHLGFGMLVMPSVWDWYVQWREARCGFYTVWEVNMLQLGMALTRRGTVWIRQHPELADRMKPVANLVTAGGIAEVRGDWDGACDRFFAFAQARAKEIERVARVHRDTFEPILPVLEAASPVAEYRRITEEILRLMPDARRHPRAAAETVRSFLMLRVGMHLGVRQKNLRQLLICPRDRIPTPERQLEARKVGEMRWNPRDGGWEVELQYGSGSDVANDIGFSDLGHLPVRGDRDCRERRSDQHRRGRHRSQGGQQQLLRMREQEMNGEALSRPCDDCGGSGKWFDMPPAKRRIGYGEMGPSECTTRGGWGLVPAEADRPVFDMIVAMRASPKWR